MRLVASAIVRNEADRYLDTWLRHLLSFCDEVRLLDDGSTDATVEIAGGYDRVYVKPREGAAFLAFESDARNELLRWTMEGQPEYVLGIDADEFVGDAMALRGKMAMQPAEIYELTMREVWKVGMTTSTGRQPFPVLRVGLRVDGLWGDRRCPLLWRAPAELRGSRWQIPRRKLACGREPQAIRARRGVATGVGIYHFGWTREAERQARAERYFEHDQGKFHADRHLQSILWPDELVELNWQPWPVSIPDEAAQLAARPAIRA